ncbi:MAG: SAM-dependent methyltransferase [Comamonadaceae bacterium CG_4_9_14_3_um_filter_60_33]|nr:MAG: SAM-dependent methyltransferase [Comamonadaceae bacterium CG_4_9_14_3_um_filter_60_33]
MHQWMATPPGAYLLAWERAFMVGAVADVFGFHALQLGLPELDALAANRMPHRWLATETRHAKAAFVTDFAALPFPSNSLDLVVLPHALELTPDPHTALSEVARVLVPEGRVVICGFNPMSLWGLRQQRAHLYRRLGVHRLYLPQNGEFIGYLRCRDWLRLLSFEIESGQFGCYKPALASQAWLQRFAWMDKAGARWWPFFGAVYGLVAVKRVRGMTLLNPAWNTPRILANAPVSVANSAGSHRAGLPNISHEEG